MIIKYVDKKNIEITILSYIVQKKENFEDFLLFKKESFLNDLYQEIFQYIKTSMEEKNNFALSGFLIKKDVSNEFINVLYNSKFEISFEELKQAFIEYSKENLIEKIIDISKKRKIETKEKENFIKELLEEIEEIKNLEFQEKDSSYCINLYSQHLENASKQIKEGNISGISTGIYSLDNITMGLKDGEYILVAARPSMGKTSLATEFFISALNSKRPGVNVLFSLEMPIEQIMGRIIAQKSNNLSLKETIHGMINDAQKKEEIENILEKLLYKDMIIEDYSDTKSNRTIERIESQLKKIEKKYGKINFIEIDYVQLIDTEKFFNSQRDKITYISNRLQRISKMFKCPIVVLSQLNRELEKRIDKRPILSDLRDSGSLEQDADIIIFIYRNEVYLEQELKEKIQKSKGDVSLLEQELQSLKNSDYTKAELIVRKNRNGPTGIAECYFIKHNTKFTDILPPNIGVKEISLNELKEDEQLKEILYKQEKDIVKSKNHIENNSYCDYNLENKEKENIISSEIDIKMPDIL